MSVRWTADRDPAVGGVPFPGHRALFGDLRRPGRSDPAAFEAWTLSSEGKAFIRKSGEAWGAAHTASGEDPEEARAKAERTIAFYTGA